MPTRLAHPFTITPGAVNRVTRENYRFFTYYCTKTPIGRPSIASRQARKSRSGTSTISANYPLPFVYSYRLVEAEFEILRVLKELYRNAENLMSFLTLLALALTTTLTGKNKDQLLWTWRGGVTFGNWFHVLARMVTLIDEEKGALYRSTKRLWDRQKIRHPSAKQYSSL